MVPVQTHCFYLEDLHNGGFRCHWWLKGSTGTGRPAAKAVWSATSSIALSRLPGANDGKLGLQLLTNVAPAGGGGGDAVTWQAPGLLSNHSGPPGSQYRGSPALLKSALQKNVRLCRPASAIRQDAQSLLLCRPCTSDCSYAAGIAVKHCSSPCAMGGTRMLCTLWQDGAAPVEGRPERAAAAAVHRDAGGRGAAPGPAPRHVAHGGGGQEVRAAAGARGALPRRRAPGQRALLSARLHGDRSSVPAAIPH